MHFKANTEQSLYIYQNVVYTTLFSGTASDSGNPNRLSYAGVDLRNPTLGYVGTVNGQFRDSSVYNIYAGLNPITAVQFGYWTAAYSQIRGQATFYDNATISYLKGVSTAAAFLWTTGNGEKRDIRLDWAYYDRLQTITIQNNTRFFYNFAGWYYAPGGAVSGSPTYDGSTWRNGNAYPSSTGTAIPLMYYKMFVGGNLDPWITNIVVS